MGRPLFCIFLCLLYLCSSYLPCLAAANEIHPAKTLLAHSTSSTPLSAYANVCTQLYQAMFGQPPTAAQLYNMEYSLHAADPTGTATTVNGLYQLGMTNMNNSSAQITTWLTVMGDISFSNPTGSPVVALNWVNQVCKNCGGVAEPDFTIPFEMSSTPAYATLCALEAIEEEPTPPPPPPPPPPPYSFLCLLFLCCHRHHHLLRPRLLLRRRRHHHHRLRRRSYHRRRHHHRHHHHHHHFLLLRHTTLRQFSCTRLLMVRRQARQAFASP